MGSDKRKAKAGAIRHIMDTEGDAVAQNARGFNQGRYQSVARLDRYEALKERARAIKEQAIERLPELIDQVRTSVEANGGVVYLARDAADANRRIVEIAGDARRLVKSKSMTSEELEVNEHLEAAGVDVVETDLGEWVLQVAEERPSHIVAPAIHKSREGIAELFNRRFQPETPLQTAEELTAFAREKLGALIRGADVGMTGANFIVAETGTIALVTSEGNARKTTLVPPTHIAVAGVEKIIPSVEDLQPFIELIGRSGTGQDITSYVSLLTPPLEAPVWDFNYPDHPPEFRDRSFHLILIDNGRMALRDDPQLRETLYCIRCSACANVCANFQSVGGHAFGGKTYSGGIATGWEAGIHGLDTAATFNDFCTGCSRCVNACPVQIDIPWINTVVRDRINRGGDGSFDWLVEGLIPDDEPSGLDLQKRVVGHFAALARFGSALAPLSNWLTEQPPVRALVERVLGLDRRRPLPRFQRTTLRKWFLERSSAGSEATHEVVLYPDVYTNYVRVDRGKAAVRALEALGVRVHLPPVTGSGRAPLSQGMVRTAEQQAQATYDALTEHLDAGRAIVVIEPSDLAMFEREYEKLLPQRAYERLRDASFDLIDYLHRRGNEGVDLEKLRRGDGQRVAYHSHCQQRTLGLHDSTVDFLRKLGYDVLTSDMECCGMAGSFGYKTEYYELSMDVGQPLREQFAAPEAEDRTVVVSGTSCQEQLESLLDRPVMHVAQLIAPDAHS